MEKKERYKIEKEELGKFNKILIVDCPFCHKDCSYQIDQNGLVDVLFSCEHFKGVKDKEPEVALFEREVDVGIAVCPYCNRKVKIEYYENTIYDYSDACEHFNVNGDVVGNGVLFEQWQTVEIEDIEESE